MWIFKEKSKKNLENLEEKWFESLNFRHIFTVQTVFFTFIVYIFGCVPSTCWEFQWNWIEWLWPVHFLGSHSWEKLTLSQTSNAHMQMKFFKGRTTTTSLHQRSHRTLDSLVKLPKFMNLQGRIQAYVDLIWFFFFFFLINFSL